MTQRPGGLAEAAFAVAPTPARRRSAEIGTSRAGEKKATEAVLRHGASSELLPEMADQLWRANPLHRLLPISWGEITRALVTLSDRSMADPVHATTAAANLGLTMWREAAEIWIGTAARWWGLAPAAPARPEGAETDRRFDAPEWEQHPFFRLLKQSYLALSKQLLEEAERQAVDPDERQRLVFHLRQFLDAISPTTFLPTNPAALRKAWETGGGSVADGLRNLLDDLRQGRLSMTDTAAFAPGKNLATTPGKVVYRNRLIELIHYAPMTTQTYAVPLLFIPPWINKFYVLDLQPKNSLVRFLLEQGFSVFMISWKNPDASMEAITFEDYMTDGPLAASDVVREITGAERINPVGYCIGGTLLAMTLAYLAARRDDRFGAATFMVSLLDFSEVGDTAVFIDEPQIAYMEHPQVLFSDPDWFFWAYEQQQTFRGAQRREADLIYVRATHICIPQSGGETLVAEYVVHPTVHKFGGMELVPESRPHHEGSTPTFRLRVIDMSVPRQIAEYDKFGCKVMVAKIELPTLSEMRTLG